MGDGIELFTDGACRGNPGVGGWGTLMKFKDRERELYGADAETTNNRMELMAVIEGLSALKSKRYPVTITTDSRYVMDGIRQWLPAWKQRNWQTAARKPVKNVDLWQRLDELTQQFAIDWQWVKGHSGHPGNERADALANQAIDEYLLKLNGRKPA